MEMAAQLAEKDAIIAQQESKISLLLERIAWFERQKFGAKSERHPVENPNQLALDLNLEAGALPNKEAQTEEITYTRKKAKRNHPGRHPLPEHLPRKEVIIEPEENTTGMKCIGEDVTEVLAKIPAVLFVIRYIRKKYASQGNDTRIVMGTLPSRTIPKGIADESLLADILVSKYMDHLPLYRQAERFKRESVDIARSTLSDWVAQTAQLLSPLYEALKTSVTRYAAYLQADESPIKVLDKQKKGKSHQGYMWVYRDPGDKLVLFDYRKGRGREGPTELLQHFEGHLQTDGYAVYDMYEKSPKVILMGCMAHARRYFFEAKDNDRARANYFLTEVQKLYKIEESLRDENADHEMRELVRQQEALPILKKTFKWLKEEYPKVLPKSAIGKAIAYSLQRWNKLSEYAYFGMGEIDNNGIENQIRPLALGRKNYLFAGSHKAAQNTALLYSILLSAKQNKLNPYRYLYTILKRLPDHPINKIAELLPHNFQDKDFEQEILNEG